MKITVELLWLGILLIFYALIFSKTGEVGGWDGNRYLFFVGCYYLLEGTIETFFLSNCTEFSDLVRSGDLDTYLLRPIDEQFLLTCRSIDWSTAPKLLLGPGVMVAALWRLAYAPRRGLRNGTSTSGRRPRSCCCSRAASPLRTHSWCC